MGCEWSVQTWDTMTDQAWNSLMTPLIEECHLFDATFSRFKPTSLISRLANKTGRFTVPPALVELLLVYQQFFRVTDGKLNPLIGNTISDLGYDATYSLTQKERVRLTPNLLDAITILDETTIRQDLPVMMDLGALGKGYFVDVLVKRLREAGVERFLVNGSGDVAYHAPDGAPIWAGLEHPQDASLVVGRTPLLNQSLCASSGNRRKWRTFHHIVDPFTHTSPDSLLASWVKADSTMLADGLATALFFTDPDRLRLTFAFEYCLLSPALTVRRSPLFGGELF